MTRYVFEHATDVRNAWVVGPNGSVQRATVIDGATYLHGANGALLPARQLVEDGCERYELVFPGDA